MTRRGLGGLDTGKMIISSSDDSRIVIDTNTGNVNTFFVDFWPYAEPNRLELTWGESLSIPCIHTNPDPLSSSDEHSESINCSDFYFLPAYIEF